MTAYFAQTEEIAVLRDEITRYQRLIGELPGLKAGISRLAQEQPLTPYLLSGSNAALAAASLQRQLQEVAANQGVRIASVRAQQPVQDGPLERISVQARLQTGMQGLRDILYQLESSNPYLFVEDLSVTARPVRREATNEILEVRLTVSGLRAPDAEVGNG